MTRWLSGHCRSSFRVIVWCFPGALLPGVGVASVRGEPAPPPPLARLSIVVAAVAWSQRQPVSYVCPLLRAQVCTFFYICVLTFYTVASDIMQNTGRYVRRNESLLLLTIAHPLCCAVLRAPV